MPGVRSFRDMREKYELKYDGATVTARWTALKTIIDARFESASSPIVNIIETVRTILSTNGVPAGLQGPYYAFAQELGKLMFSHSGATLQALISGKKAYYVTAHKLDPEILDKIVLAVLGTVPPY
ncbi:MAG: hypothetical protein QXZ31_05425 [Thermofilaceae archaeon]